MRRTSLSLPSILTPGHVFPPTTKAVAMQVLILIAMAASVAGATGFLFPFQTSESVALVGMGCLFAILARIVQVCHQHRSTQPLRQVPQDEIGRT